ncbi:response regulator transcription factor [Quadrisphaera sp. DSM 44207]|uniref:response regulator transcription factor n=1 Tax=Quadrisphaera sp. DSM 44207 TaxID=1881057 RepID=UPI0008833D28|nr:response regulator transcription factor [Quadrisphaera sp. DSM 44207]SDQ07582.1 two component transcriptional regulator, LuxR family [Quadrisphaera sp. DSM 44207]
MSGAGVRIVLADDQAMVRSGLAMVLGSEPGFCVVAQCEDGSAVLPAVRAHRPDLVLLDVRMPRVDGPEATRRLRADPQAPPVLALTTFDDDEVLWAALDAGAAGFVLKDSPAELLVDAVRAVAASGAWLDPRVLPRVLERARGRPDRAAGSRVLERLTPREADVLRLVCRGASNGEIAQALRMAERTVKSHVSAILAKLGARDRAAAIVAAYDAGLDPRR